MCDNPFKRARGTLKFDAGLSKDHNNTGDQVDKAKRWGKVKFRPKVPNDPPKENTATPWAKYKNEILQTNQEEQNANALNMESPEAKEIMKTRAQNYRKMLIMEKRKEPTQWESFGNDSDAVPMVKIQEPHIDKGKKQKKCKNKHKEKPNPNERAPLLSKEELKNFDSKNLSFHQSNKLRKVITKTINLARGSSLETVVKDMKRQNSLKESVQKRKDCKNNAKEK